MPKRKRGTPPPFVNVGLRQDTKTAIDAVAQRRNEFQYEVVQDAMSAMIAGDESLADIAHVVKPQEQQDESR